MTIEGGTTKVVWEAQCRKNSFVDRRHEEFASQVRSPSLPSLLHPCTLVYPALSRCLAYSLSIHRTWAVKSEPAAPRVLASSPSSSGLLLFLLLLWMVKASCPVRRSDMAVGQLTAKASCGCSPRRENRPSLMALLGAPIGSLSGLIIGDIIPE